MPYEEYQRKWKVIATDDPNCKVDDLVSLTVIVSCGGRPYAIGEYAPGTNTIAIARDDEYEIRINEVGTKRQIEFRRKVGSLAGSWTAEDDGSWLGDS